MPTKIGSWISARYRLILVLILLVAAFLRLYGLNNLSPPGLEHDEVAHWLINRDILDGNHAVYFTDAYGHEAGFHYVQTASMVILGDNTFALRLPSAFAGLLLIAVSFALTRRLFGIKSALLSAGLLAVLFWPIFYSRLALRAIALPLLSGITAYLWWKAWQHRQPRKSLVSGEAAFSSSQTKSISYFKNLVLDSSLTWFAAAGLFAGLSLYTYMASRVIPIFFLIYLLYLGFFHRAALKLRWRGILFFALTYVVVAAPLAAYLLSHPGSESRIAEVDAPLIALIAGELKPVLDNSLKVIGMFGTQGDPLWRQNVAYLPVFDPLIALFFYIGLMISLWRWREPRHLFIVLWLFTATIPSIVTIDAPSSIRIINALPVITIFPVIGLELIHFFRSLSTVSPKLSPEMGKKIAFLLILSFFIFNSVRSARAIFQTWPDNEEVAFVWQASLTEGATFLDTSTENGPVAIGGWSPETMDSPTMQLSLTREDLSLRYFDPGQSLIIPVPAKDAGDDLISRIIHPTPLPIHPSLVKVLDKAAVEAENIESFTYYEIIHPFVIQPQWTTGVNFGDELTFLGYDIEEQSPVGNSKKYSDPFALITYWQVDEATAEPRRFFLHFVDEKGNIVAQDDRLGAPAAYWSNGDIIIQRLTLTGLGTDVGGRLQLGVYNPETGHRLLTDEGAEFEELGG